MGSHFWDMDHTLIACDCEVSWKRFLVAEGLADPSEEAEADRFFADYAAGHLDAEAYLEFQLREFRGRPLAELEARSRRHFEARVRPQVYGTARAMVKAQLERGDLVAVLTATNRVLAAPVAEHLGIPLVLATEFEVREGRFTGSLAGSYCLGPGKLARLRGFCAERGLALADVHYYGDSLHDIPVLEQVGHPVAANPVPGLEAVARVRGWEVVAFEAPGLS